MQIRRLGIRNHRDNGKGRDPTQQSCRAGLTHQDRRVLGHIERNLLAVLSRVREGADSGEILEEGKRVYGIQYVVCRMTILCHNLFVGAVWFLTKDYRDRERVF